MKPIKKIIGKVISIVILIILIFIALFVLFGERAIKAAIETAGTKALNVDVSVEGLDLSLLKGQMDITGLNVANPAGFKMPYILNANQIYADIDMGSLFKDTVVIKQIKLDGIVLSFEQEGFKSNVSTLLKAATANSGSSKDNKEEKEKDTAKEEESSHGGKSLVIDDLLITNVKVQVKMLPGLGNKKDMSITLSKMEFKDIGKSKKVDLAKLTEIIFLKITSQLTKEAGNIIPADALKGIKDIDPGAMLDNSLGKIFDNKNGKDPLNQIKDATKGTLDGIGNLFKKDEKSKE